MMPLHARSLAANILVRVEQDRSFAAAVLDHELKRSVQLSTEDKSFITELVYGTLRLRIVLEKCVLQFAPRGIHKLDPYTRAHILIAVYQIHCMRVPTFAAVSEAVGAIRKRRGTTLAGFANSVLRKVAEQSTHTPLPQVPEILFEATPLWLRNKFELAIGKEDTHAFLTAGPIPAPVDLRVRHASLRNEILERLKNALTHGTIEPCAWSPIGIRLQGVGNPHQLPGYHDGMYTIQEEGSQLIGHLLNVQPGHKVLDACTGRGNKASLLADALIPQSEITNTHSSQTPLSLHVADVHPEKSNHLIREFHRLHLPQLEHKPFGIDWSMGTGNIPIDTYDCVLVDAPCSGTGTLRRRPEIQLHRQAIDLEQLQQLQIQILVNTSKVVKPGGRLIYAICSVLREEAEDVVSNAIKKGAQLEPIPFELELASRLFEPKATQGRLLTHKHQTDGYFVANLQRI